MILFLFSSVAHTQVPVKESGKEENTTITNSTPVQSEAGNNPDTKSFVLDSCVSRLEGNEVTVLMDTITAIIHVDLYCLCSDYLTGAKVKLSNKEQTYERITDKLGCDFRHIQPGIYMLEVDYEAAKKFEPMEVMVMSGAKLRWKIFLCE
ncbi:hypothetical protein [Fluviicola taffensis]|uniref:hypothetical protein n=1 Tax=Fluviicola taffensis TaxID=191579 RepID=UPI003137D010